MHRRRVMLGNSTLSGTTSSARAIPRLVKHLVSRSVEVIACSLALGFAVAPITASAQAGMVWAVSFNGSIASSPSAVASTVPLAGAPPVAPKVRVLAGDMPVHKSAPRRDGLGSPRSSGLPDVAEAQVARWATAYSTVYKASFVRAISRGQPYGEMIATKLRNAGLPGALIYLPVVESRFSAGAKSSAGAVGLWQFMPSTARGYGLRVDTWVDERRDPYRATDAAVRYLRDLHRNFGDWYLALAAYNGGDGRVARAVRASGGKGSVHAFWAAQSELPRETRDYVPQLLGVARVGANPAKYGVVIPVESPSESLVRVMLPPASRLTALADVWGISLDEIARLNPALNWAATPPDRSYAVVVPSEQAASKRDVFMRLPLRVRILTRAEIARISGRS